MKGLCSLYGMSAGATPEPPQPHQIVQLMYQFIDNLNFKISIAKTKEEYIDCLLYTHYEFIRIHPFNNGNGGTGRMLMNLVAMKFGYKPLMLAKLLRT